MEKEAVIVENEAATGETEAKDGLHVNRVNRVKVEPTGENEDRPV